MKHIITAIALLAASAMPTLAAEATAAPIQLSLTQEYRMWSAEKMIDRLINRFSKFAAICNQTQPQISDLCKESVIKAYPRLQTIREVAASGDEVRWAILIDEVHGMERNPESTLNDLVRK